MNFSKFLLIVIVLFFLFTRLYQVVQIPPSVYWDEASIGYNAFSISESGKDEWGRSFPLHFRAFGEFKLPLYIYISAFFVKLFGLNEFSIRFPAILFSLGSILITFLLTKALTGNKNVAYLSAFFLSISFWFFIFSRTGYEATAGLMFYLLGIYLILESKKPKLYLLLATSSFILSMYSYNSFRIITPLTILVLFIYQNSIDKSVDLKKNIAQFLISIFIFTLCLLPIVRLYVFDNGASRFHTIGQFNLKENIKNYLSHFSLDFLLLEGDRNLRSQQKDFGQLYLPEVILLLLGIIYIISRKSKLKILLPLLLIAPIPAALTKESPHALRSLSAVTFICIISSVSILFFEKKVGKLASLISLIFLAFFLNYFYHFITGYSLYASQDWQYGYKRIFVDYRGEFAKYDRVIISDEYAQPYIFGLFYLNYDPNKFREEVLRSSPDNWGFSTVLKFGKFEFGKTDKLSEDNSLKNVLIFNASTEKSLGRENETIKFLDGSIAFRVYKK